MKSLLNFESDQITDRVHYRYSDLDLAIQSAMESFKVLRRESISTRIPVVHEVLRVLKHSKSEIFKIAHDELGRNELDLECEWQQTQRLLQNVLKDDTQLDGRFEPRGPTAIIGSYVWPIFNSIQFSIVNFLCGNSVILKPSEKASLTTLAVFKVLREAIPELSTIQVLLGEKEMGRRLICHEHVATVIFQGSFEVAMRVKQDTLSQPSKEVLIYSGAKNPSIVFQDAPIDALSTLIQDCFQGGGQNCQSVSVIFVQNDKMTEFLTEFRNQSRTHAEALIDGALVDRYLKFIAVSEREGAEVLERGRPLSTEKKSRFVSPTVVLFNKLTEDQVRKSVSLQTEIFAPHVSVIGFESEAEVLQLANALSYGRSASLWTESEARFNRLAPELQFGQVVWNQSLLTTDPWQSFQAKKRSGNHACLGKGLFSALLDQKVILK